MLRIRTSFMFLMFLLQSFSTFSGDTVTLKILGINDFHGQISTGKMLNDKPVGGAGVLASYLHNAQIGYENKTIITLMGDQTGASAASSGLLHDEPTILFLNSLANGHCSTKDRMNEQCNLVADVGNHEFDKGTKQLFELIYGTHNAPVDHWIDNPTYDGATFPFISANIVDETTGQLLFPPYVIKEVQGIKIAFVGAILQKAADSILASNIKGIKFTDEAEAINHYVPEILAQDVNIIVVLIHQGGGQIPYEGPTKRNSTIQGEIVDLVKKLDDHIPLVMTGHTHQFTNALITNNHGKQVLLTQAKSYSMAFAEVLLEIDRQTQEVVSKSAQIITTDATTWPGTEPDQAALNLVEKAEKAVAIRANQHVGTLEKTLTRKANNSGEIDLGNLIAEAYRFAMKADIAVVNPHSLRNDLLEGEINWGDLFAVIPFSNELVKVAMTGEQIQRLLEQQWMGTSTEILQIAGFHYTWDNRKPLGHRILNVSLGNQPLLKDKLYTVVTSSYFAQGNGAFTAMKEAKMLETGTSDVDAITAYIRSLPQPFKVSIDGRIKVISED